MTAAIDWTMEESMIRAMLQDWVNAIRAKDADAIVSCQSEPFVHYSLAPPLLSTSMQKSVLGAQETASRLCVGSGSVAGAAG